MAHTYLSDPIEATWAQPEHETFVTLAERIEDMLGQESILTPTPKSDMTQWELASHEFDEDSLDCLMQTCYGPCYVAGRAWSY